MKFLVLPVQIGAIFAVASLLLGGCDREAHAPTLEAARNLGEDAKAARNSGIPIVLVATETDCTYCMKLKKEVLHPILVSGDYDDKAVFREMRIRPGYGLKDFNEASVLSSDLAKHYAVSVAPTVLILGPDGTELAQRLIGINNSELYGYYLDQAIETASAAMARQ